jgi:hypothetical protein
MISNKAGQENKEKPLALAEQNSHLLAIHRFFFVVVRTIKMH